MACSSCLHCYFQKWFSWPAEEVGRTNEYLLSLQMRNERLRRNTGRGETRLLVLVNFEMRTRSWGPGEPPSGGGCVRELKGWSERRKHL